MKRNAREKGKQGQITPTKTQVKLFSSERPSRLDFSKEIEGSPPSKKNLCVTQLNTPTHIPDGSAVFSQGSTVGRNELPILELPRNWEPPDSSCVARLRATLESLYSLLNRGKSKCKTYGKS